MAVINPPGYLHNLNTHTAQTDRIAAVGANLAFDGDGLTWMAGVRGYSDLRVTAQGTPNMTVNVAAGFAFVKGTLNAFQGVYSVPNDGTVNLTISAANATLPRRDLIIIRVYDSVYGGSENKAAIEVVTGTAAATPADPVLPANSLVLARIFVAAGATSIANSAITDLRKWTSSLGGIIPVRNATERDALNLRPGQSVFRIDSDVVEVKRVGAGFSSFNENPTILRGTASIPLGGQPTGTSTINFPAGRFSAPPSVVVTPDSTSVYIASTAAITATKADITLRHFLGSGLNVTIPVNWIAAGV